MRKDQAQAELQAIKQKLLRGCVPFTSPATEEQADNFLQYLWADGAQITSHNTADNRIAKEYWLFSQLQLATKP